MLPIGHPDVDDLFLDHEELPEWHPDLSLVVKDNPIEILEADLPTVYFDHPDIHEAYLNGERLPQGHPSASGLVSGDFTFCKSTYLTHSTKKVHSMN